MEKCNNSIDIINIVNKAYADGYKEGIDYFADHIRLYYSLKQEMGYVATNYEDLINYILELAEQLKKGVNNEN